MTHTLAVRLDSMGDVLVTGPAIRALAAASSEVTVLAGPRGTAAAHLLPGVDRVLTFAAPWILADPPPLDPAAVEAMTAEVAALACEQAVIFTSFHQSPLPTALMLRMAGVPHISALSVDYPGALLDIRHTVPEDIPEVQRALSLTSAAGFAPPDDDRLAVRRPLPPPPGGEQRADIIIHPGAASPARTLSPQRWSAVAAMLAADGHRVAVTGSTSERSLAAAVAASHPAVVDMSGITDLATLAAIFDVAQVVVAGNTGPAHLAAAVGTPVVSVFPPTVPVVRWGPWRVPHVILGWQDIGCAGCRARVCPLPGQPCLAGVGPTEVSAAVVSLVETPVAA